MRGLLREKQGGAGAPGALRFAVPAVLCLLFCLVSAPDPVRAAPKLFGTVEFRMDISRQKHWLEAMARHAKAPIFVDEKRFSNSVTWKELREKAEGRPLLEQLKLVNRFWNMWPYRTDPEVYRSPDYWASPNEFLSHSGDCEDYSIIKYYTLKELGVPPDSMRIVVVRETIRGIGHAVLAVYDGDDIYILDNLSEAVRHSDRVRNYEPQFSVNEKYRWVHVKAR